MNNTLCLGIFAVLVYARDLEWEFSAGGCDYDITTWTWPNWIFFRGDRHHIHWGVCRSSGPNIRLCIQEHLLCKFKFHSLLFVFLFFHTANCGVFSRGPVFCCHRPSSHFGERPRLEMITIGREKIKPFYSVKHKKTIHIFVPFLLFTNCTYSVHVV